MRFFVLAFVAVAQLHNQDHHHHHHHHRRHPTASCTHESSPPVLITYLIMTSKYTFPTRGALIDRTWAAVARYALSNVVFVSDAAIHTNANVWVCSMYAHAGWVNAQGRFVYALLDAPVRNHSWVFLCDDDAFVNHRMVVQLASQLDAAQPTIHSQLKCAINAFCGGAGALFSPRFIELIRGPRRNLIEDAARIINDAKPYEPTLSNAVTLHGIGTLYHQAEFHSQPPAWYKVQSVDKDDATGYEPISFHYVDEDHQQNGRTKYQCNSSCHQLYDSLFEQYYLRAYHPPSRPRRSWTFAEIRGRRLDATDDDLHCRAE